MSDADLIEDLGGAAKVAAILGFDRAGGVQRVHNWKLRGIPARVKLEWPHLFLRPASVTAKTERPAPAADTKAVA